jgi:hypothetical protein
MFSFEVTEEGVRRVSLKAKTPEEETRQLQVWPIVRRNIEQMSLEIWANFQRAKKQRREQLRSEPERAIS